MGEEGNLKTGLFQSPAHPGWIGQAMTTYVPTTHHPPCPEWSEVAQSCPTLCDPMDSSLPGSAVHGIFQARILEWTAISFSRGSSQPRDRTRVSCIADRHFTIWTTRQPFPSPVDLPDPGIKPRSPALQADRNRTLQKPIWHFRQMMTFLVAEYTYIMYMNVNVKFLSRVRLFATPWTVAYQAPLSMGFSRQ